MAPLCQGLRGMIELGDFFLRTLLIIYLFLILGTVIIT